MRLHGRDGRVDAVPAVHWCGMTIVTAVFVVILLGCSPQLQEPPSQPNPYYSRFTAEVTHGENFEREFGNGLVFKLAASDDPATPGWIIEVRPKGSSDPDVELVWVATPPYRLFNPRYLNVSYGNSAAQSVAMNPRQFSFLRNPEDYASEAALVREMLWPASESQSVSARAKIGEAPTCEGTLRILEHRLAQPPDERIEWLKFEVELCMLTPGNNR